MVPKSVLFVHTETTWGNVSKGTKVTYPGFDYSTQTRMYLILDECHEETEDRAPAAANEGTKRKAKIYGENESNDSEAVKAVETASEEVISNLIDSMNIHM